MELNGREVGFRRTIWATNAIMKMCPDGDLSRFTEIFSGDQADQMISMAGFICAMSKADEQAKEFEARRSGGTYTQDPITLDEIMNLEDFETFNQLQSEAIAAWVKDSSVTVETEPVKSKKKASRVKK